MVKQGFGGPSGHEPISLVLGRRDGEWSARWSHRFVFTAPGAGAATAAPIHPVPAPSGALPHDRRLRVLLTAAPALAKRPTLCPEPRPNRRRVWTRSGLESSLSAKVKGQSPLDCWGAP